MAGKNRKSHLGHLLIIKNRWEKQSKKKEEVIDSHLPESVRREMERLLMEMKLDFFKRGVQDIAYVLKKEGDILKISLEPKAKKEK